MTYKGTLASQKDVRIQTYHRPGQEDVRMMTSRPTEGGLKPWEMALVQSSEVKRKATVAQLCQSHLSISSSSRARC